MGVCTCARVCSMLHVQGDARGRVCMCVEVCICVQGCDVPVCVHACGMRRACVHRYMGLNVCLCTVALWHVHTRVCTWAHMRGRRNGRWRVVQILARFTRASFPSAVASSSLPWPCDRQCSLADRRPSARPRVWPGVGGEYSGQVRTQGAG